MQESTDTIVDWATFQQMRAELGASFVRILGYFHEDGDKAVAKIEDAMNRRDCAALILPAHTLKSEARQFGATPVGDLAEAIETAARRGLEARVFPDDILPQAARLRPLYQRTRVLLEAETNPLMARRGGFGSRPANQDFGRL